LLKEALTLNREKSLVKNFGEEFWEPRFNGGLGLRNNWEGRLTNTQISLVQPINNGNFTQGNPLTLTGPPIPFNSANNNLFPRIKKGFGISKVIYR